MSYTSDTSYTSETSQQILTAFFDSKSDADNAVERLVAEGVSRGDIKVVAGDSTASTTTTGSATAGSSTHHKGFFEALGDFFLPDEDRYAYAEGLGRGGYLVSVETTAANRARVLDILDDEGSVDMSEREESWRSEGWSGYSGAALSGSSSGASGASAATGLTGASAADDQAGTIKVVEENLKVGKRDVSHGRVRVRSYVVEEPVSADVSLRSERVDVVRRAVDRPVDSLDAAFRDQTIELEETAQEAVIAKEARVKEEIDLNRKVENTTQTVSDTVRRTEVEIEDEREGGSLRGTTITTDRDRDR